VNRSGGGAGFVYVVNAVLMEHIFESSVQSGCKPCKECNPQWPGYHY
jgi:hypothetical protein